MKTFNQFVTEVQAPLSQGEKNFFNAHNPINHKDLVPGVTDQEHVFNGSPQRKDPKTASYEDDASEKAYDKGLKAEEVELGEKTLTPAEMRKREEIVKSLKKKGMEKGKAYAIATSTAKRVAEENDDGWYAHKEMHGKNAVSKEDWKKGVRLNSKGERVQMKSEEVEIDEQKAPRKGSLKDLMAKQSKKYWDSTPDYEIKDDKVGNAKVKKEEVEQIDEISKQAALNYVGAASYDKSSHASDIGAINQIARTTGTNDAQRKEREALSKKHGNRSLGIQRAAAKLGGKGVKVPATEEVEPVNELNAERGSILKKYLSKTSDDPSRKAGRKLALNKLYADPKFGDADLPKISAKVREEVEEIDEARTKKEESNEADQNIHVQLNKSLSIGKHVVFKNGDKKQIPAAHANKALHMLRSAKPAEREQLQNSMSHSHDRFVKTVTHGRAVVDHPGAKKISLAKSVKEAVDPTTTASDRGAVKTSVRLSSDGRPMLIKRSPARDEIKIGEALDPVGKEDSDIDNDGKHHTKSDKYLHNRRKSIKHAIRRAVKEAQELTAATVAAAAATQTSKGPSSSENMQQDSVNKLKQDVLASKEQIKLPPTQGNEPIGGESDPSRVGGKFSVEEEIALASLYDVLSEENKAMFEELMETDEGIERLLSFAKEQGI